MRWPALRFQKLDILKVGMRKRCRAGKGPLKDGRIEGQRGSKGLMGVVASLEPSSRRQQVQLQARSRCVLGRSARRGVANV